LAFIASSAFRLRVLPTSAKLLTACTFLLPTFQTSGMTLLKRLTLVIHDGKIEHLFYPVFPPDQNAGDVIAWLTAKGQS